MTEYRKGSWAVLRGDDTLDNRLVLIVKSDGQEGWPYWGIELKRMGTEPFDDDDFERPATPADEHRADGRQRDSTAV